MKKAVIVLGDPLSSGGSVVKTNQLKFKINGLPIATLGDKVSCPIPLHGSTEIIEGYPKFKINGLAIALHGHKVGCGCTLVGQNALEKMSVTEEPSFFKSEHEFKIFDEQFTALDNDGLPIKELPYLVIYPDGKKLFGRTNKEGVTRKIRTNEEDHIELFWGDEALAKHRKE